MNNDMKVVQTCAESNTEGSVFIEESNFELSDQTKHHFWELTGSTTGWAISHGN